jgi:hypothetical protein
MGGASVLATLDARAQNVARIDLERTTYKVGLTGSGPAPSWTLVDESGRKVLAQTSKDRTDYRFPLAIFDQPVLQDLDVAVRFRPVAGDVDRAAGIAVRLTDPKNYYVLRANALEDNVRLYRVVKGDRQQFAGFNTKVPSAKWQELRLAVRGSRFEVFLDGLNLFGATDATFARAGRIALWTKADSVTYFDDLRIQSL